ncbi:flagellar hook assembly protein FlgD [Jeotgalibacillus proteolyticus]|uniref:flagellar hook assembly protein FlgD n=1 Tax=Jeotgalibacillus proteolyticus TaxID=2082395 RepID=UPI003CF742AC
MNVNSVNNDLFLSSLNEKTTETKQDSMGKDQFLKLLIAQLSNQDPTQPMEDKEFIAQMASFSTLEQMTNMSESFEKFASMQEQTQLIQYNEFVGKEVKWDKLTEENDEQISTTGRGTVETVRFKGGAVEFELTDGTLLSPGNISEVKQSGENNTLQQASMFIGKNATWIDENEKEAESKVISVSVKDGAIWLHTENEKKIKADELTQISQ